MIKTDIFFFILKRFNVSKVILGAVAGIK